MRWKLEKTLREVFINASEASLHGEPSHIFQTQLYLTKSNLTRVT